MSTIQATARLRIHAGRLDDFKAAAAQCRTVVQTRDQGTLQYDWFLSDDATECIVREAYRDSEAVFAHMENLGPVLGDLLATCDMELEVFGEPTDALAETMRSYGARIYAPLL